MTFGELARRWTSGELNRDFPDHVDTKESSKDDRQRLNVLLPALGDIPLTAFVGRGGVQHADAAMRRLDELRLVREAALAQAQGRQAHRVEALDRGTRRQYAQVIHRVLALAGVPGKTPPAEWVMRRTGHTTSQQLQNYRRDAETLRELDVGTFAPLNEIVPELRDALLSGAVTVVAASSPAKDPLPRVTTGSVRLVGHDRLELSANGLRVRCSTN